MRTGPLTCLTVVFLSLAAAAEHPSGELKGTRDAAGSTIAPAPIDSEATPETKALFHNLRKQMGKGILFGHQHTTLYGIGWNAKDEGNRGSSDVKTATGAFPAVYGWDFCSIPFEKEANATMVALYRKLMIEAYQRGGINTVSWHMRNPVTGEGYKSNTKAMHTIKPGGEKHEWYKRALDDAAAFFKSLKTKDGVLVPIIFRPFHEKNRNAFWWNQARASKADYDAVWRFTVKYLRDEKGVHNLLYANSPGHGCKSLASYRNLLPEKDYVDLYGVDCYFKASAKEVLVDIRVAVEAAEQDGKIAALTEGGQSGGMTAKVAGDHYTKQYLDPIKSDPVASKIAYMLVWRNAGPKHHWVPVKGDSQFEDFKKFAKDPAVIFEDRLPPMYVGDRP